MPRIVIYHAMEDWNWLDCAYYVFVAESTIGFGDIRLLVICCLFIGHGGIRGHAEVRMVGTARFQ